MTVPAGSSGSAGSGASPTTEAWDLQRAIWEGRVDGRSHDDYLLLLEHPHVRTPSAATATVPISWPIPRSLARVDVGDPCTSIAAVTSLSRAGPARRLPDHGRAAARRRVRHGRSRAPNRGDADLRRSPTLGIEAWAETGYTGVWTGAREGGRHRSRVGRGVSMHGFALNVDPDLGYFEAHRPVRIADRPVTSIDRCSAKPSRSRRSSIGCSVTCRPSFGHRTVEAQLGALRRGGLPRRLYDVDRMVADGVFAPSPCQRSPDHDPGSTPRRAAAARLDAGQRRPQHRRLPRRSQATHARARAATRFARRQDAPISTSAGRREPPRSCCSATPARGRVRSAT